MPSFNNSRRPTSLSAAELAEAVRRIGAMTIAELRVEWRAVRRVAPPSGLSKDLMARELAYRLQERALGGLSQDMRRMLRAMGQGDDRQRRIKLGSLIVREHQGVLHEVTVVPGGFSWKSKTYASLSTIARLITGTSWNGPRFFGLRAKRKACAAPESGPTDGSQRVVSCRRRLSAGSDRRSRPHGAAAQSDAGTVP